MKRFRNQRRRPLDLEAELRLRRPKPSTAFLAELEERVRGEALPRRGSFRVAFAGALTVGMLVAVASLGGVGYAAWAAEQAIESVKRVAVTREPSAPDRSAASDQYAPRRVTICHHALVKRKTKHVTIRIRRSALAAHLRHGDTRGSCRSAVNRRAHSKPAHKRKHHRP